MWESYCKRTNRDYCKENTFWQSVYFLSAQEQYHKWIQHDCRNILAVLEDLPSVKPSADHLCELIPRMQPRFYSISSSPKVCFVFLPCISSASLICIKLEFNCANTFRENSLNVVPRNGSISTNPNIVYSSLTIWSKKRNGCTTWGGYLS